MGGAPKYNKQNRFHAEMAWKKRLVFKDTVDFRGTIDKYPKCVEVKPYGNRCPKEPPQDPKNVPSECKQCPYFLKSRFYSQTYMTREKRIEMLKKRGLPLVLDSKS